MKVTVTQEDIDKGEPDNCQRCPVALALNRATGFACGAGVASWWCNEIGRRPMPEVAAKFIVDFDYGRPVTPVEFDVQTS